MAGIAASSLAGKSGAAQRAKIVSLDVMDDNGMAKTSDVIAAADWILANKWKYGIRVANFSLHSSVANSFRYDPLDKAVEKLWFNNVVVVAAAGNYGTPDGPSGVPFAPGNDPFVITVGASDTGTSVSTYDDVAAPWSAYGYTLDGFAKPDLVAPGRYMIGPVSTTATLYSERPDHVVEPGYMELSGTSFSAPIVTGIAALILGRHPDCTPDQVKGALMLGTKSMPRASSMSVGVGEVNAKRSVEMWNPPNPNRALNAFIVTDSTSGGRVFDAASWADKAKSDASVGRRLLGGRVMGYGVLVRRELGRRLLERCQLGFGLLGRHRPRSGVLGRPEPGQRIVGGQCGRRARPLLSAGAIDDSELAAILAGTLDP